MINFIIGIIIGILALMLLIYIIGTLDEKRIRKDIGEDYEMIIMPKSEVEKFEKYIEEQNK